MNECSRDENPTFFATTKSMGALSITFTWISSIKLWHTMSLLDLHKHTRLNVVNQSLCAGLELFTDEGRILDKLDIVPDALLQSVMRVNLLCVAMVRPVRSFAPTDFQLRTQALQFASHYPSADLSNIL